MLGWIGFQAACQESRHQAAVRFKNALMTKDTATLFSFVDPEETEALRLDQKSFDVLMNQFFYKEWKFNEGNWSSKVSPGQFGETVFIESISNPASKNSLGTSVVGDSGRFRVPGFVYFVLYFTALKRYGVDKTLIKSGGLARISAFKRLLDEDSLKLLSIGSTAYYDPSSKSILLFEEAKSNWAGQIASWREKHPDL